MDTKVRAAAIKAAMMAVGAPRAQRILKAPMRFDPMWKTVDEKPAVEHIHIPAKPRKILPFVNHRARYKKMRREASNGH